MITERKDDMQVRETPPFAPVLMESTRAIGYSLEAAIADIIDNSVAAKAGKVQLSFFRKAMHMSQFWIMVPVWMMLK